MTLRLFLVRHAQSANNAQEEQCRIPDPPITPLGVNQARCLAIALRDMQVSNLFTSPFLRSIQTAFPAAEQLGLRPTIHRDLYEQGGCYRGYAVGDRHPMPGMGRSELQTLCPSWLIDPEISERGWNELGHYESVIEARVRARRVAAWLTSQVPLTDSKWALIIHADFKLRLLEALLDREDIEQHLGSVVNTSITRLSNNRGRWKLDFWNAHQHLAYDQVTT
jgi:2,3-bisphosphoglycerate-dependent phosphoglycerate mutase